jgi:nucleoside 2-deoxyribosyltransferase
LGRGWPAEPAPELTGEGWSEVGPGRFRAWIARTRIGEFAGADAALAALDQVRTILGRD